MINRIIEANKELDLSEKKSEDFTHVSEILEKLEFELEKNKFGHLDKEVQKQRESAMERAMTAEDREFVEMVDQEYYKRVKTSEEFYRRKKLILQNLEKLQKKVEK